jgi:two-component sensor histidine kinase
MSMPSTEQQSFHQEVAGRFGLVPNFFASAKDAPELVERLWDFAKAGYLDNPIPSLFKERLFVYVSRFCEVRYCIARHCAFLLGFGHSAGDPKVAVQSVDQVLRLLKQPTPWQQTVDDIFQGLDRLEAAIAWPEPETPAEWLLFSAAALLFAEPARGERVRRSLRRALGGRSFEYLMGLLTFIRSAHYWTLLHPEIELEDDILELMRHNEELSRALLEDPEAGRCQMGVRLFAELEDLRALNEKRELEQANRELQRRIEERDLLFKEANHRLKNSLQIVSSMLHMQIPMVRYPIAAEALRSAESRVMAIAAVHERLYKDQEIGTIRFDVFLRGLCEEIALAYGRASDVCVETSSIMVPREQAISLALITNELLTNAFKYGVSPCRVILQDGGTNGFRLIISDRGAGPKNGDNKAGLGSRMITAFVQQIGASMQTTTDNGGYHCELHVPFMNE